MPYVSIIIPVLNGEKFIERCLQSLVVLNYPKECFEIILVDNGSTDKTVEIVRNYQKDNIDDINIRLCFEDIKSSYVARNLGIRESKGDIIAFTDIDCIVDKEWLANIIQGFSDKTVGGIAGDILPESKDSLVERYSANEKILSQKETFNSNFLPYAQTANAAYKKELFDRIGYFDDVISGGDADYSWRMQLETEYKLIYIQDAVVLHKHRTDLKGLFKQRFKHGYGSVLIGNKYKKFLDSGNTSSKLNSKNSKHGVVDSIKGCFKQKDYLLLLPILANASGFNLGKIYAKYLLSIDKLKNQNQNQKLKLKII